MIKAVIFGAAPIIDYDAIKEHIAGSDLYLCADGGFRHASRLGILPYAVIGDMDSIGGCRSTDGVRFIEYNKNKDQTDTELAIDHAIRCGAEEIILAGCIYGRMDQTVANIQLLLKYMRLGKDISIVGERDILTVTDRPVVIKKREGFYISVFALSECVEGLSLKGTKYTLVDYMLKSGDAIGVSNEFAGEEAVVDFEKGELLIILSAGKDG